MRRGKVNVMSSSLVEYLSAWLMVLVVLSNSLVEYLSASSMLLVWAGTLSPAWAKTRQKGETVMRKRLVINTVFCVTLFKALKLCKMC